MCGNDKIKQSDLTILFFLSSFLFSCGDVGGGVGDQCKRPIRPPPAHTTGMIHLARNRVNQTLLIISDYHYSFSLFLIIVIIINIISDSLKTGTIRSYWLFLPSHVLHFRKKKIIKNINELRNIHRDMFRVNIRVRHLVLRRFSNFGVLVLVPKKSCLKKSKYWSERMLAWYVTVAHSVANIGLVFKAHTTLFRVHVSPGWCYVAMLNRNKYKFIKSSQLTIWGE